MVGPLGDADGLALDAHAVLLRVHAEPGLRNQLAVDLDLCVREV